MTIWIFVTAITIIACATLYYAGAGRRVNATSAGDATASHFRLQLRDIDADAAAGRLSEASAIAAKSELAREVMRAKAESNPQAPGRPIGILVPVVLTGLLALGGYWALGRPELPGEPLAGRDIAAESSLDLEGAIKTIEARLALAPDDLRGWQVIAPAYGQLGRVEDAVRAYRQINRLAPPTAESETDLGEALVMAANGDVPPEAVALFRSAAGRDSTHIRSRFYLAGAETASGDYANAITHWQEVLALAKGDEPWVVTARDGLATAEAGLNPAATPEPDQAQIDAMVDGLDARLAASGGSVEEWTQLVRSRLVQGRIEDAQQAYDRARKAYPDALMRADLDVLAADSGLVARPVP
ncbi:MAG: c-type cytochrome biogenesis protein CcmI [Devosia sp.]